MLITNSVPRHRYLATGVHHSVSCSWLLGLAWLLSTAETSIVVAWYCKNRSVFVTEPAGNTPDNLSNQNLPYSVGLPYERSAHSWGWGNSASAGTCSVARSLSVRSVPDSQKAGLLSHCCPIKIVGRYFGDAIEFNRSFDTCPSIGSGHLFAVSNLLD